MGLIPNPLATYKANKAYEEMHALFIRDQYEEAVKKGEEILGEYPEHTKTLLLLALIESNLSHFQAAREHYNHILEYCDEKEARLGRANSSFALGKYEDALNDYLTLYEKSFSTTQYLIALGKTYHALGLDTVSLRYHTLAVNQSKNDIDANLCMAQQLLNVGHYKDARGYTAVAKDTYYKNKKTLSHDVLEHIIDLEKEIDAAIRKHRKTKKK